MFKNPHKLCVFISSFPLFLHQNSMFHSLPLSCHSPIQLFVTQAGIQCNISAKKKSVCAEWLHQCKPTQSDLSETPWWLNNPFPASIPRVALHIALRLWLHHFFLLCQSCILNEYYGTMANCDHMSEWVHWVHAGIRNSMWWVMLWKSLLVFHLPVCKMQFSIYSLYTSFQITGCMRLLTIHRLFCQLLGILLVAISAITCTQPTMLPML